MEFCLLGPLVVRRDGTVIPVQAGKQRAVLAALLLNANRVVPVEDLAEALWGPRPPPSARVTVQNYVKRLRQALGDTKGTRIGTRPGGYVIGVGAGELDVARFEELLGDARGAARDGSWDTAAGQANAALALWRGGPLADVESEVLTLREIPRLAEMRLQALETRIDADLHQGRHADVIIELRQLAAAHQLRERLHALLMLALYRDGRQAESLDAYQHARQVLVEELGAEPGAGLQDLHQRILTADPALTVPERALSESRAAVAVPHELPAGVRHFAGRASELEALTALLGRSDGEMPGTVVISAIGGTAGVGKTALAVHWAHQVADRFRDGQLYADLRGFDPSGVPSAPADVARRFLSALGIPDDRIPSDPDSWQSLYRSSLADKRMLIVLDNARDAAQVRPLLPGSPGCFVLVTSRNHLTSLVVAEGAHLLTVDLLSQPDACELVALRLDRRLVRDEQEAVSELVELCARLPIAVSIAVARAAAHPVFPLVGLVAELRDTTTRLDVLDVSDPASSVRAVFSWSYENLSGAAARMFRLVSMHAGPDISIPAAASLAGLSLSQARRAVSELTGSHLLTEHSHGRFTFHDLLRAYAADHARTEDNKAERDVAMRRLFDHYLHTSYATSRLLDPTLTTISLGPPQPGTLPEAPGDYEQAWIWAKTEHRVLLATARQATATGFEMYAWQILHSLEPFFFRLGMWHEWAAAACTTLDAALRAGDMIGQAYMHRGIGRAYALLGSWQEGQAHLSQAVAGFRKLGNRADEARAHINMGAMLRQQGRYGDALSEAAKALRLYRAAGHPGGQAGALNNVGLYHVYLGNYQEALACCQKALTKFNELGNRQGMAHALDSVGYAFHFLGQGDQAIAYYKQSLDAFREYGDRCSEADTLIHLGETHHANGNPRAARSAWQEALSILIDLHHTDASRVRAKLTSLGTDNHEIRQPETRRDRVIP
jgi:DNA-binding SARP family transcriptional activator/tetratricopeptide (TPR) repeat protein